jgi:hypothetical protein
MSSNGSLTPINLTINLTILAGLDFRTDHFVVQQPRPFSVPRATAYARAQDKAYTKEMELSRREHDIQRREKDLSAQNADITARERNVRLGVQWEKDFRKSRLDAQKTETLYASIIFIVLLGMALWNVRLWL